MRKGNGMVFNFQLQPLPTYIQRKDWRLILTNVTDEKRFSVLKMVLQNSFGELVCLFSLSIVDCSAPLTTVHFNVTNVIRCSVFKVV